MAINAHKVANGGDCHLNSTLQLTFGSDLGSRQYLRSLTSLLQNGAAGCRAVDNAGQVRRGLTFGEILKLIETHQLSSIDYDLRVRGNCVGLSIKHDRRSVTIGTTIDVDRPSTELIWLQSALEFNRPFPVLALPVNLGGLTVETFHPLVALGVYTGKLTEASCVIGGERQFSARWTINRLGPNSVPVNCHHVESIWLAAPSSDHPAIWYTPSACDIADLSRLDAGWWRALLELCKAGRPAYSNLKSHLARLLPNWPQTWQWSLEELPAPDPESPDLAAKLASRPVLIIKPQSDRVRICIADDLTPAGQGRVLLHAMAHLALGHIRVGDTTTHIDTMETITRPSRHRDLLASQFVARYWSRPVWWGVESLADCTPQQKSKLYLWKLIDQRLVNTPHLHEQALKYQPAAYQRQAAERLVGMLDKHRGAMLCDGVGLGKTYVATTVIVHYINQWLDALAARGEAAAADPYRITIIVPNQVVSAWKGVALPSAYAHNVAPGNVRIIAHSKFSNVRATSEILSRDAEKISDLEHLILSDLVIVDESHNLRNNKSDKTVFLRKLLRLKPRLNEQRKVLLLTATPLNNTLDDLESQLSLIFSSPRNIGASSIEKEYLRESTKFAFELRNCLVGGQQVVDLAQLGNDNCTSNLNIGSELIDLTTYLREQKRRLDQLIKSVREAVDLDKPLSIRDILEEKNLIAERLLDAIVVQRSRAMCHRIENTYEAERTLLFRPARGKAFELRYAASSDNYLDILKKLIQLFDPGENIRDALTLKINHWKSLLAMRGVNGPVAAGLQRTLLLKRFESSLGALLASYMKIVINHINKIYCLYFDAIRFGKPDAAARLRAEFGALFDSIDAKDRNRLLHLVRGEAMVVENGDLLLLLGGQTVEMIATVEVFELVWSELRDAILSDFAKLLKTFPVIIDKVLGHSQPTNWPKNLGGNTIWPESGDWALQITYDQKVRELIKSILTARKCGQKVIVFSEYSTTIKYIKSIIAAIQNLSDANWDLIMSNPEFSQFSREDFEKLTAVTSSITQETSTDPNNPNGRDRLLNRFAPYYRLCPYRSDDGDKIWQEYWTEAIFSPLEIMLTTDILSEGVNLQDVPLLINFDVHWNPVKMIQRAGRLDRRLDPRIEQNQDYHELRSLTNRHNRPLPEYYWHHHPNEPPKIINMILPDELEERLRLLDKIWMKEFLIELVFGLDTSALTSFNLNLGNNINGLIGLNSTAGDRTIEQLVSHHARLSRELKDAGIATDWANQLTGCLGMEDLKLQGVGAGIDEAESERVTAQLRPPADDQLHAKSPDNLDNLGLLAIVEANISAWITEPGNLLAVSSGDVGRPDDLNQQQLELFESDHFEGVAQ